MKSFLSILKITLLVALLIGVAIGYLFFRVWQKNERPTASDLKWSEEQIILGHQSTLDLTITAPWHRELTSASPGSYPNFLIPLPDEATLTRGSLNLSGQRDWKLSVPFVATDTKPVEGLTSSFPVKSTKRISPNSVNVTLPNLSIILPEDVPTEPNSPGQFLTEDKPKEDPKTNPVDDPKKSPWLWALLALFLIPLIIYFLKRTGVIKTTPPWEKALARLDQLNPNTEPVTFYSKLTDILKQYTSDRYSVRGRSKTSAEFIQIVRNHPDIPNNKIEDLPAFARLADSVKFADHIPHATEAPKSLELIRSFVNDTTPAPDPESQPSPKNA